MQNVTWRWWARVDGRVYYFDPGSDGGLNGGSCWTLNTAQNDGSGTEALSDGTTTPVQVILSWVYMETAVEGGNPLAMSSDAAASTDTVRVMAVPPYSSLYHNSTAALPSSTDPPF